MNVFSSEGFWAAIVTIVIILSEAFFPQYQETLERLTPHLVAIVVALFAKSSAIQIAAFWKGYTREKGIWIKK